MRYNEPLYELGIDQTTDADAGTRRVVRDDRQILAALVYKFVNQPMPKNPPIMSDAPSGIFSTTAAKPMTLFMFVLCFVFEAGMLRRSLTASLKTKSVRMRPYILCERHFDGAENSIRCG
jgi:hypothetical protein